MPLLLGLFLHFFTTASASSFSPLPTHPLALMHQLPAGEKPGWETSKWISLDFQEANYWNTPTSFIHQQSGKTLYYFNDFEQTLLLYEMGFAVSEKSAFSIEMPIVVRHGGFADHLIAEFHKVFGFIDFNRERYAENQNNLKIQTDGVDKITSSTSGIGNAKIKFKFWLAKNTECSGCGWGLSLHLKIPFEDGSRGLSSGGYDESLLVNFGTKLWSGGNIYLSTGVTTTLTNKAFEDWPLYKLQFLSDMALEIDIGAGWNLILAGNLYSPFMDKSVLTYTDSEPDPGVMAMNKVSSGLNSLTEWRAFELLGFRHGPFIFYAQEDWGLGSLNGSRGSVYVNGAPDIVLGIKSQFNF